MSKCMDINCTKRASFGIISWSPMYCFSHKEELMIDVVSRRCIEIGCDTRAAFGIVGSPPTYCASHRNVLMVYLVGKSCIEIGCTKSPSFGFKSDRIKIACKAHKDNNMVRISGICEDGDCCKRSSYGIPGTKKPIYCTSHRKEGMCNVVTKRCESIGCEKFACFNYKEKRGSILCTKHKEDGMVPKCKMCIDNTCNKRATYGIPGQQKQYCRKHKPKNAPPQHKCLGDNCNISASYGHLGGKYEYCAKHKLPDQVSLSGRNCEKCTKIANFNEKGELHPRFCKEHASKTMIDVKNKKCSYIGGCSTQPLFNFFGLPSSFCKKHSTFGMIKNPTPKCLVCKELATHSVPFASCPTVCSLHAEKYHLDYYSRKCASCGLTEILDQNNLCYYCKPSIVNTHFHSKEMRVKEYLDFNGIVYDQHDKIIDGGSCGKERPDFLFFSNNCRHAIILEVDENQHFSRPCECEQIRMVNISNALAIPTIFIRYNPDKYVPKQGGKKIEGDSHLVRMKKLVEWVAFLKNTTLNYFTSAVYLYFDGWDGIGECKSIITFDGTICNQYKKETPIDASNHCQAILLYNSNITYKGDEIILLSE